MKKRPVVTNVVANIADTIARENAVKKPEENSANGSIEQDATQELDQ